MTTQQALGIAGVLVLVTTLVFYLSHAALGMAVRGLTGGSLGSPTVEFEDDGAYGEYDDLEGIDLEGVDLEDLSLEDLQGLSPEEARRVLERLREDLESESGYSDYED